MLLLVFVSLDAALGALFANPFNGDAELTKVLSKSAPFAQPRPMSNWALETYAVPHETIRHELFVMHRVLSKLQSNVDWHVAAFFRHWSFIVGMIHAHHESEEHPFFPLVEKMTGQSIPESMTTDHATLLRLLEGVTGLEARFKQQDAAARAAALTELRAKLSTLMSLMGPHLDEEESVLVPMIQKHLHRDQLDRIIDQVIADVPPLDLLWEGAHMLVWLDHWATPAAGARPDFHGYFASLLPTPIYWLCRLVFVPRVLDSLAAVRGIETGTYVTYYKGPRTVELALGAAVVVLLVLAVKALLLVFRVVTCGLFGGKAAASKHTKQTRTKKDD